MIGFYSLFSVTEEPWVTSGGTPISLSQTRRGSTLNTRTMDELLLEGQESGQIDLYTAYRPRADNTTSAIRTPRDYSSFSR